MPLKTSARTKSWPMRTRRDSRTSCRHSRLSTTACRTIRRRLPMWCLQSTRGDRGTPASDRGASIERRKPPKEENNVMQTERGHTKRSPHVKLIPMLLAAAFLVTTVAISPVLAKKNEDQRHGDDRHHEHKEHDKHWHEYPRHVYYPPPVVYAPSPEYFYPPPPPVYSPPAPTINFIIPLSIH